MSITESTGDRAARPGNSVPRSWLGCTAGWRRAAQLGRTKSMVKFSPKTAEITLALQQQHTHWDWGPEEGRARYWPHCADTKQRFAVTTPTWLDKTNSK